MLALATVLVVAICRPQNNLISWQVAALTVLAVGLALGGTFLWNRLYEKLPSGGHFIIWCWRAMGWRSIW